MLLSCTVRFRLLRTTASAQAEVLPQEVVLHQRVQLSLGLVHASSQLKVVGLRSLCALSQVLALAQRFSSLKHRST
jgi:hypothetical protein